MAGPGLRNHIVIHNNAGIDSCSGSGPSYTITYDDEYANAKVGHHVYVEKRGAGDGGSSAVLSTYVYVVTAVGGGGGMEELGGQTQLTIKYLYDTAGTGDDSPCDLPSGTGSSGSPETATHDIVMVLGDALTAFVD
tara:strand:+ start:1098 stop:1505 length:408 start_codon:yes stop_codon:yes gene_type:complete